MFVCAWCGEEFDEVDFGEMDEDAEPICLYCHMAGEDQPRRLPFDEGELIENPDGEELAEYFTEGMLPVISGSGFEENPGRVPGVNAFTVTKARALEFLGLNDFLMELLDILYESAPPDSAAAITRDASKSFIETVMKRVEEKLVPDDPTKGIKKLIVVDGSISEGGREASSYLQILNLLQQRYLTAEKKYLELVDPKEWEQAKIWSYRSLWNITGLIRTGEMGKPISDEEILKKRVTGKAERKKSWES